MMRADHQILTELVEKQKRRSGDEPLRLFNRIYNKKNQMC